MIYDSIIQFCIANGIGKFASQITELATVSLLREEAPKIYAVLTKEFKSTGEISKEVGMCSKDVSSILARIQAETTFIKFERNGKLKYWAKV